MNVEFVESDDPRLASDEQLKIQAVNGDGTTEDLITIDFTFHSSVPQAVRDEIMVNVANLLGLMG